MISVPRAAKHWQGIPIHLIACLLMVLTLLLAGCNGQSATPEKKRSKGPKAHLVEVISVKPAQSSSIHERSGTLKARRIVRIHNQEEGRINQLPFYEGDVVKKGQLLAELDHSLLKAQLDKAKATRRQALLDRNRLSGLVKKRAASKDELARTNTALDVAIAEQKLLQTRIDFTTIQSPLSGVVTQRLMEPGDLAAKHSHLLTITDPKSLMLQIHLSELLLPNIKRGESVTVRIDALGNRQFTGSILRIHPDLDPVTRQGIVEVKLKPIPPGARAGQFARVTLATTRKTRILVPFGALRRDRSGEFVYLMDKQQKARRAVVRSGIRITNQVEILEGLKVNDQVIFRGFLGITNGKKVTPVNLETETKMDKG